MWFDETNANSKKYALWVVGFHYYFTIISLLRAPFKESPLCRLFFVCLSALPLDSPRRQYNRLSCLYQKGDYYENENVRKKNVDCC